MLCLENAPLSYWRLDKNVDDTKCDNKVEDNYLFFQITDLSI